MLRFHNGTLYMRKIDVKEPPTSIISDIQASYVNYVENTAYEDVKYLEGLLREQKALENITLKIVSMEVRDYTSYDDGVVRNVRNIPVTVDVYNNGQKIKSGWEIFKIPTMYDFGKFNVNGNLKSVMMQLRSSYDISYERKGNTLNIAMPKANVRIISSMKGISIKSPKGEQPLYEIMLTMLRDAEDLTPITDYIKNAHTLRALKYDPYTIEELLIEEVHMHKMGTINLWASEQYKLGPCRDALNRAVQLDRGIGYELADPINGYKEGYIIDDKFICDMYRSGKVTYTIRTREYPERYFYADPQNIIITEIPAGMPNCAKLRDLLPEYAGYNAIPNTVKLTEEQIAAVCYLPGTLLNAQDFEFLDNYGIRQLHVSVSTTSQPFLHSMIREITGNYMAPLYKLVEEAPEGRDADEWVYYYNNPTYEKMCPENITCHDLVALCSIIGEILTTGNCDLLNRDTAFLKRIVMCGEIFSESLRAVMREFVTTHKNSLGSAILSSMSDGSSDNPFFGLNKDWYSYMIKEKYLATIDTVNLCAEISQACRINTPTSSSQEILDEQRHLAIQYFGRICPFETPAGKKLGMVNSRAMGSRVKDGLLQTAYREVKSSGRGIKISKEIVWLTAQEEIGHKFGDILSLKQDKDGNYINCKILARVPNTEGGEDPFIFKNINAFELISTEKSRGYVNVYPEQFVSPTINLVPFACSDDAVRLSFGASQIRQAINLVASEKPLVVTPMYEEMFNFASNSQYIAEKAGTIVDINGEGIVIRADETDECYTVITKDRLMSKKKYRIIDYRFKKGDHVGNNELLAEGYVYPQDFVVRSPYDGYINEVNHDHIVISSNNSMDAVDLDRDMVNTIPLKSFRQLGNNAVFLNIHVSAGDYVRKGQILADTCTSRDGFFSPSRNPLVCYWSNGYTYEDGVCATERATIDYVSFLSTKTLQRTRLSVFKHAIINQPDSFKYIDAGATITKISKYAEHSSMSADKTAAIMATHKSHGIFYDCRQTTDSKKKMTEFTVSMLSMNKLKSGDKMSGRHGNKGVVSSKIYKDSEALQLSNGMTVDFILGPCGIPSRMNLGQIWELHLSLIAKVLSFQADSPPFNGGSPEEVQRLMHYAYVVANRLPDDPAMWNNSFTNIANDFRDLPKELHDHVRQHLAEAYDWKGVFDKRGCAKVFNPETNTWLDGEIIIGFPMFNKLMQEADEKLNVRSGPMQEAYARTSSQPIDNINSAKGQRMAEMELAALAALGCAHTIKEILNEKSDNEGARINTILKQLKEENRAYYTPESMCSSRAVDNLLFLLETCGVKLEVPKEVTDVSFKASINRQSLNLERYLKNRFSVKYTKEEKQESADDFSEVM